MAMDWETVKIFISSTFDDMHAERDYLVKRVFPELREWCERRKLRLVDIDLRWGVREEDTQNKKVVEVCLRRIDEARPFFLCFLGQRRGWVPSYNPTQDSEKNDISADTFIDFPDLKNLNLAGKTSATELEIIHALVNPLHRSKTREVNRAPESYDPVKYAFFYIRDDSYLSQLPKDFPDLRKVYTNEELNKPVERSQADEELQRWVKKEIPELCKKQGRPLRHYSAKWNPKASSPELLMPLSCPSLASENRWRDKWIGAGIQIEPKKTSIESLNLVQKAQEYNKNRSSGRLSNFEVEGQELSQIILADLQAAITERYPDHIEIREVDDLQKEIDQQEQFLYTGSEGFIERKVNSTQLDDYVNGNSNQLFVLTAEGGKGKSTLLANWIKGYRERTAGSRDVSIHFRFIGKSDRSTSVYSLLQLLLREIKEVSGKITEAIPDDPQKLRQELQKLLESAGKKGKIVIVLDALNQLESGLADLAWLPFQLPPNVKFIISFKRDDKNQAAEDLYQRLNKAAILREVEPFSLDDRRELVKEYLKQYLKDLDKSHLDALITSPGADNPLFLKVVLSELRVFGAFTNLSEKIRSGFKDTPVTAFQGMLKRLEDDPAYSPLKPKEAVPFIFGLLSHARQGLSLEEITSLFVQEFKCKPDEAQDTINLYLRQVRSFLAYRDGRYDFFFESFKLASQDLIMGKESPKRLKKEWHELLAGYFFHNPLNWNKERKKGFIVPSFSSSLINSSKQANGVIYISPSLILTFWRPNATSFPFMM
jgi:hypothetical protein